MTDPVKKVLKRIALGLLFFISLLLIFTTFFLKDIVNSQLQKEIRNTFGDFYQLSFENSATALSTSGFSINFEQVSFEADTSNRYMLTKYPAIFFQTDLLKITDINVLGLLFSSKIAVKNIEIEDPNLLFFISHSSETEDSTSSNNQEEGLIERIDINHIWIEEGSASFIFEQNKSDTLFSGKKLRLEIENLGIDLESDLSVIKTGTLDQLEFSLEELRMTPLNSDYHYGIESLNFNYKEQLFQSKNLTIEPDSDPVKLAANNRFRTSIFRLKVDSLAYQSDDFKSLKEVKSITGQALIMIGIELIIDRNKSLPLDQTIHKKLFHESLLELPIAVDLDSISITDAIIDYRVHSTKSSKPGNLLLTSVDGNITNIRTEALSNIEASFEGTFMEDGPFNLNLHLPLKTPHQHSYDGAISNTKFTSLNPLISNLTKVRMEEGWIERIDFEGSGAEFLTEGIMNLAFHDLKLSVTDEWNRKQWFKSGLGNLLVRNNNRSQGGRNSDKIRYSYKRPPYKDHLDMYGSGLINGFALGVLPKTIYNLVMNN